MRADIGLDVPGSVHAGTAEASFPDGTDVNEPVLHRGAHVDLASPWWTLLEVDLGSRLFGGFHGHIVAGFWEPKIAQRT